MGFTNVKGVDTRPILERERVSTLSKKSGSSPESSDSSSQIEYGAGSEASMVSIDGDAGSNGKKDKESAFFKQSMELLRRRDTLQELHRIARRVAKLMRQLRAKNLSTRSQNILVNEINSLGDKFRRVMAENNVRYVLGGFVFMKNLAPALSDGGDVGGDSMGPSGAPSPLTSSAELPVGEETTIDENTVIPAPIVEPVNPLRVQEHMSMVSDTQLQLDTLTEMVEVEAEVLTNRLLENRNSGLGDNTPRISHPDQADELVESLLDRVSDEPEQAVTAALKESTNITRILYVLMNVERESEKAQKQVKKGAQILNTLRKSEEHTISNLTLDNAGNYLSPLDLYKIH